MTLPLNSFKRGHDPHPVVHVFTDNPTLRPQPHPTKKNVPSLIRPTENTFFASLCTSRRVGFNSLI